MQKMMIASAPPFLKSENVIIFWKTTLLQEAEMLEPIFSNLSNHIAECT